MSDKTETNLLHCYRHPEIETGLRCNRCEKPICAKCAKRTPVGFRCPDCIFEVHDRYYSNLDGYINPFEQPLSHPVVTMFMLGALVLIWVAQEAAGGSENGELLIQFGANYGPRLALNGELWRLFTAMFLHIGAQHLVFNCVGLAIFGFEMEQLYRSGRYLMVYLLSGLFGNLLSFAIKGIMVFSAGASGAIFGVLGMQLGFYWFYRRMSGVYGEEKRRRVFALTAISLLLGLTVMPSDNAAHMGGLISGAILGYLLVPRYQVDRSSGERQVVDKTQAYSWLIYLVSIMLFVGGLLAVLVYRIPPNFVPWLQ